jgi:hypothetical protein
MMLGCRGFVSKASLSIRVLDGAPEGQRYLGKFETEGEGSSSFLKKRTKKLLSSGGCVGR